MSWLVISSKMYAASNTGWSVISARWPQQIEHTGKVCTIFPLASGLLQYICYLVASFFVNVPKHFFGKWEGKKRRQLMGAWCFSKLEITPMTGLTERNIRNLSHDKCRYLILWSMKHKLPGCLIINTSTTSRVDSMGSLLGNGWILGMERQGGRVNERTTDLITGYWLNSDVYSRRISDDNHKLQSIQYYRFCNLMWGSSNLIRLKGLVYSNYETE